MEEKGKECSSRCFCVSDFGARLICTCEKAPLCCEPGFVGDRAQTRWVLSLSPGWSLQKPLPLLLSVQLSADAHFLKGIGFILYLLLTRQSVACGVWSYYQGREKRKVPLYFSITFHVKRSHYFQRKMKYNIILAYVWQPLPFQQDGLVLGDDG